MGYTCLVAHHAVGGKGVMTAVWVLAEYFRTGGGVPGAHYNAGKIEREDPYRAYFWFSVLANQAHLYEQVLEDSVRLGLVGKQSVARVLFENEKVILAAALNTWHVQPFTAGPENCLREPPGLPTP